MPEATASAGGPPLLQSTISQSLTAGHLQMTLGWIWLETKKVATVGNVLLRTLEVSFSRLKIAVIHNTSVIDGHFLSPESIFCEKHHRTSVHKQPFCERPDTGLARLQTQFPCHVQMARCIYMAEAGASEAGAAPGKTPGQDRMLSAPPHICKELSLPQRQAVSHQCMGSLEKAPSAINT